MMTKKTLIIILLLGVTLGSCIKHEVIPAPEPTADLKGEFQGTVGGAYIEYTENVNGYYCAPSIAMQTSAGITDAQYLFAMISQSDASFMQVGIGSLSWNDPTGTSTPALTLFNQFFDKDAPATSAPNYSNNALAGFEVVYSDTYGDIWKSDEINSTVQDVSFVNESISQESDNSGDYSKFTCNFATEVFHTYSVIDITVSPQTTPPTMVDSLASIMITDAQYKGYFKR
jgi:hypothetical protein